MCRAELQRAEICAHANAAPKQGRNPDYGIRVPWFSYPKEMDLLIKFLNNKNLKYKIFSYKQKYSE